MKQYSITFLIIAILAILVFIIPYFGYFNMFIITKDDFKGITEIVVQLFALLASASIAIMAIQIEVGQNDKVAKYNTLIERKELYSVLMVLIFGYIFTISIIYIDRLMEFENILIRQIIISLTNFFLVLSFHLFFILSKLQLNGIQKQIDEIKPILPFSNINTKIQKDTN